MTTLGVLSDREAKALAEPILARRFDRFGYRQVHVAAERDFDGEPILRMTAEVGSRVPARAIIDTLDAVRKALMDSGDERFVFLSTSTSGGEAVEEDET